MKKIRSFVLIAATAAVVALCFTLPSVVFRYQDRQSEDLNEKISSISSQNRQNEPLTLLERLELVGNMENNYRTESYGYDDDTAESALYGAVEELLSIQNKLGDFSVSYQDFFDAAYEPVKYTVSDVTGRSVSVWDIGFSFDTDVYMGVIYDQELGKLLKLTVLYNFDREPEAEPEDDDLNSDEMFEEYYIITDLCKVYFGFSEDSLVSEPKGGKGGITAYDDSTYYELPIMCDGEDVYIN
ncbi:MAG: hypothetical protein IJ072_00355 [Oscillospiraceae bacterium]|nr:hypothetical protein [Oscillospiraceae bacterium]